MSDYTGVANLEIMEEAVRYNDFLLEVVVSIASPGETMLDFGAGTGFFAQRLVQRGFDVVCLEPDPHLREALGRKGLRGVASLSEVSAESVDAVYSLNVLEHIEDDAAALAGLHRPLKPGGRLLLYVPAFMLLYSAMDRRIGHFRRYRKRPLAELVRSAGFEVDDVRYADSLGFAASLALKAWNRSGELNPAMVRLYDRWLFPISRVLDRPLAGIAGKNLILRARKGSSIGTRRP